MHAVTSPCLASQASLVNPRWQVHLPWPWSQLEGILINRPALRTVSILFTLLCLASNKWTAQQR
jgi:hypothetical protein